MPARSRYTYYTKLTTKKKEGIDQKIGRGIASRTER